MGEHSFAVGMKLECLSLPPPHEISKPATGTTASSFIYPATVVRVINRSFFIVGLDEEGAVDGGRVGNGVVGDGWVVDARGDGDVEKVGNVDGNGDGKKVGDVGHNGDGEKFEDVGGDGEKVGGVGVDAGVVGGVGGDGRVRNGARMFKCCHARSPEIFPVGWRAARGLRLMPVPGSLSFYDIWQRCR